MVESFTKGAEESNHKVIRFDISKIWVLAAPLVVAGIGFLLEIIIPWHFNGFCSGFESLGWMIMFLGGRQMIKKDLLK